MAKGEIKQLQHDNSALDIELQQINTAKGIHGSNVSYVKLAKVLDGEKKERSLLAQEQERSAKLDTYLKVSLITHYFLTRQEVKEELHSLKLKWTASEALTEDLRKEVTEANEKTNKAQFQSTMVSNKCAQLTRENTALMQNLQQLQEKLLEVEKDMRLVLLLVIANLMQ